MRPAPGERGLVLYWLDATEIHPELKDDLATVVEVERQEKAYRSGVRLRVFDS